MSNRVRQYAQKKISQYSSGQVHMSLSPAKCFASVPSSDITAYTPKPQTASGTTVDPWAGFYKKSLENRQQQINGIFPQAPKKEELKANVADHMVENCIGILTLCFALTQRYFWFAFGSRVKLQSERKRIGSSNGHRGTKRYR